jgi:hypothetical protein
MSPTRIALQHRTYGFMDLCVGSFEHLLGIANQRIHCGAMPLKQMVVMLIEAAINGSRSKGEHPAIPVTSA